MTQEKQLKAILNTIEGTNYASVQSMELLKEYGFQLQQWMAFSGEQMAIAREDLHNSRKKAYLNTVFNLGSQERKYAPSLIKDYINDCCARENAVYELADRANKACTHSINLIITCISALKEEMKLANGPL